MKSMLRASFAAAAIAVAAIGGATPAGADPLADLMDILPAGYGSDSCKPVAAQTALAAVTCEVNALPGGPTSATYRLFGDRGAMDDAFSAYVNSPEWAAATCPGMHTPEPTAVVGPDGTSYGSIACGRGTGSDWRVRDGAVAWTRDADHFLGVAYVGYQGQAYPASLFIWVRAQQIESDCAASDGTYTTWMGDAGIAYSSCCVEDTHGRKQCDNYVDGNYDGTSPQG